MRRETPRAVVRWRVMAPVAARRAGPYQRETECRTNAGRSGRLACPERVVVRVTRVKIAVCVKQVPDATVHKRLDPATNRLDRSGEGALNATDVNAVEEALRLKEATGGEVVVVSLGPEKAMDSLRKALAMGADRAVLVSDDAAAGSDLVATSHALAKALEREEADLVLFGQQSSDGDGAVLWAAVSDRLRRPMVSQVAELTVDGSAVTGKRQTEFGYDVIAAPLPAVVAVSDAINEPRYPSLKGIMGAKSKPQEVVSLADLGVEPGDVGESGSRTTVRAVAPPPREERPGEDRGRRQRRGEDRRLPRREAADLMATLVFLETHDGEPTKGGLGVLSKAAALGGDVAGVVLGTGVRDAAAKAGAYGASRVYVVEDEALAAPLPQPRVDALEAVVAESGAENILFAASVLAADVAAGLAARLEAGLNWDLTDLRWTAVSSSARARRSATRCSSTSAGRRRRASASSARGRSTRSRPAARRRCRRSRRRSRSSRPRRGSSTISRRSRAARRSRKRT